MLLAGLPAPQGVGAEILQSIGALLANPVRIA